MNLELDESYDRWLYDNDFQFWMLLGALRAAQEITTIERNALFPLDGKIIFNIDTQRWESWSKTSNCWFDIAEKSKDSINPLDKLKEGDEK